VYHPNKALNVLKCATVRDGTVYHPNKALNVRGKSNGTQEELQAKLIIENHENEQSFHVVGDGLNIPYDGLLGRYFFESKRASINCTRREVSWDRSDFFKDNRQTKERDREIRVVLTLRCETTMKEPTQSR
jgi:hypothetical protein